MTPQEKQYLTYGGIGLGVIVLYFAFKNPDNDGSADDPTGNGVFDPVDASFFDAAKIANDLYQAMKDSGTDEDPILTILDRVSQEQFGLVSAKFGKRPYNRTTGNQIEFFGITLDNLNLAEWLKEEMSSKEYFTFKLKYPKYL